MTDKPAQLPIPAAGTRGGSRIFGALMKLVRPLAKGQVDRYRKSAVKGQPTMMGFPTVLLTTVGARTGQERTHVLGGFDDGLDAWLVVASFGGSPSHPAWYINLAKNPDQVWLEVGDRRLHVKPDLLEGERRAKALSKIAAIAPRYGGYQEKTDRQIPIVRLTPSA
jgi:deazaflavin-dependent oxidoreductase (nitroreductase family)